MMRTTIGLLGLAAAALLAPATAQAQSLGTFRWQLQPFCNVITVVITDTGGTYRLEGTDDQCGGGRDRAAVTGLAFPNPDGSIGFGLTIVTAPGGGAVHVDADVSLATLGGTWRDSDGATGSFTFTPGAATGGSARPAPSPASVVPAAIRLLSDGGLLAGSSGTALGIPTSGPGTRMMWYPNKSAFRVGRVVSSQWDDSNTGIGSVAFGLNTVASGLRSMAFGESAVAGGQAALAAGLGTTASARASTALGLNTTAGGEAGTAIGSSTNASGPAGFASGAGSTASGATAVAFGRNTLASGGQSAAFGNATIASGSDSLAGGVSSQADGGQSFAFGTRVLAGGPGSVVFGSDAVTVAAAAGTFIFADRSTTNDVVGFAPNEFIVRAAGGVGFYTNAALTTGVEMAANGSSWAALSDVNVKENFRDVDGEDLLHKLANIPVREWNYKAQDAAIRHMGPTAQDFRAAFGLGDFEKRINTVDADGVALAGVKALDVRTRLLREENDALRQELAALRQLVETLTARQ